MFSGGRVPLIITVAINAIQKYTFFISRDRFRTTINVLGDSIGAGIVEHLSRHDLALVDYNTSNQHDPRDEKNEYPNHHTDNHDNLVMTTM